MFTKGDQVQIERLRQELGEHQTEMVKVLVSYNYHKNIIDSLKTMITALGGEPTGLSMDTAAPSNGDATTTVSAVEAPPTAEAPIETDQQSTGMPPKLEQFSKMTTIAAAEYVLQHSEKKSLHVDDLVFAIYGKVVRDQFKAAKRVLVSEMIRGKEKGIFRRTGRPNTFKLGDRGHLNGSSDSTLEGGSDGEDGRPDA